MRSQDTTLPLAGLTVRCHSYLYIFTQLCSYCATTILTYHKVATCSARTFGCSNRKVLELATQEESSGVLSYAKARDSRGPVAYFIYGNQRVNAGPMESAELATATVLLLYDFLPSRWRGSRATWRRSSSCPLSWSSWWGTISPLAAV